MTISTHAFYNTYNGTTLRALQEVAKHPSYVHKSGASGSRWKDHSDIPDGRILYAYHGKSSSEYLLDTGDAIVQLTMDGGSTGISIYADGDRREEAEAWLAKYCVVETPTPTRAKSEFWFMGAEGPSSVTQYLDVTPWSDVRSNYTPKVQESLDVLTALDKTPEAAAGRIILFHGPPGTGKTNLIKVLASEWYKWASPQVVLDPERFLGSAGYLLSVASASYDRKPLIILEDSGELVRKHSKQEGGQAVSRLLNMADGLATQWSDALFLITTNENIGELNEALTRKGRCLAVIEVGKLSAEQSSEWLGRKVHEEMILSDLYAEKASNMFVKSKDEKTPARDTGLYL